MTRAAASAAAERYFDEGGFLAEIAPSFARLGFTSEIIDNPVEQQGGRGGPVLIAERREAGAATTVFGYGHGDVIRGLEPEWRAGLSPWRLQQEGERLYGRGTAD